MTNSPPPDSPDRNLLLLDFAIRFFTALRTIRLYPPTNPQVQRSNEAVIQSFQALLETTPDDAVILAVSDRKLLICGEHLADKEQLRPQVQGLIALFSRAKIHSLAFQATFTLTECIALSQTLSALLGEKEATETVGTLLDRAGIVSVTVDVQRYVAIREGEQVVREELLGAGLHVSDEELANFVMGRQGESTAVAGVSRELVQELINRLPTTGQTGQHPEGVTEAVIDFLQQLSREQDQEKRSLDIAQGGGTLSALDPSLLAQLIAKLPDSTEADAVLGSALDQLPPERINALIGRLVTQQSTAGGDESPFISQGATTATLQRLINLEHDRQPEISQTIAQNIDARSLLLNPQTTLAELPEHLLTRLKQPEWSAPVIASAAQQVTQDQINSGGSVDFAAFNKMLGHYEQLLSREQQQQVARQAGSRMASMEGMALGTIIAHKFQGLFGAQLYEQVINQVSDELLDETIEHLSPKQINRMIATLTSDIPLHIGKDSDPQFKPADDAILKRLAQTGKGPEITKVIAQNIDARSLLLNPQTTLAELPEHLLVRLKQPEWSAPVIASAAQQVAEGQGQSGGSVDFSAFNKMLGHYEQLLSREQQQQVARQAGSRMASMEGMALGTIIAHKFQGLFGAQLYEQVINQVSDELLDETIEHLTPIQINRMIATLTSDIPLHIGKDSDPQFMPADDAILKRLAQTSKGPEITKVIAQNIDARSLLLNPQTTLAELPEHLLVRLKQPEWSAPVIASAAQQVVEGQVNSGGNVDFAAFNQMLGHYEQLLSREQQQQVARQAGSRMASMEGAALGNIIAQKFRGLFGSQLYEQVINQVSDELLDETIEHLSPKQINRMIATLTSDIPLHIGKDSDPQFKPADDALLKRLAQTSKGPEITKVIAQNIDARSLLLNPQTTLAELPAHLLTRLKQPEWSAPVIASAAQQVAEGQGQSGGSVDFSAFNQMLGHYEQLLSREQQQQVARQAGSRMASMEGAALGNIIAQKFRGLFGSQLYEQVINQVSDELLDETIEHLSPKQINRMIATLTSDIPLHIGKDSDPQFKPADDAILKRLAQTSKGPEITKVIAQNIDARSLLHAAHQPGNLSEQLTMRLQQPAWSVPVLMAATRQVLDQPQGETSLAGFEQLLDRYDALLNREKQLQVATQVAPQIAALEEQELGLLLVKKYKNLFGEQLYQQVIAQLAPDKLERLTAQFRALAEGRAPKPNDVDNMEIEAAYHSLKDTVRGEKMRAIVELHREQQKQQEEDFKFTVESSLERLLHGESQELANTRLIEAIPQRVRSLLLDNQGAMADSLLMQLALALQHQQPKIRANAFHALAATAEQLALIGQWPRFAKLLPALQQGLQQPDTDSESSSKALAAIGALTGHDLSQKEYPAALESVHFLQSLASSDNAPAHVRDQAREILHSICTKPVLEQLLDGHLHSETHQETTGKLLVELGPESARFQLQQLFDSESRFERKRLLNLIRQTGNPAISQLLEQLHKDSPWFVLRNSIRLLGEIGNPALFTRVRPFIQHSDPRVQQEVITTAVKIGGDQLKDFLLHALQQVDDSLKIRVINHVATTHDERFVRPLTDLLESTKPFLGKNKNDLQLSLCKTLGAIGSRRATASLSRVAQSKNVLGLTGYSDEVRQVAEEALEQIRLANVEGREAEVELTTMQANPSPPTPGPVVLPGDGGQEVISLSDLIDSTGSDSAGPKRVVRPEDLGVWAELTDRLGTEEFQTIYRAFTERSCKPEESIVSQGDKNDSLFFINQGSVKVSHMVGPRELFITSLNRGQLAGENFFTSSLWTVTLTALTPCRLYILPQRELAQWQQQFPGLRARLYEYYRAYNNIGFMLKKKGLDRRQDQRYTLSRKVQVQPISNLNAPIGRGFRAETADISLGGMAFLVRIAHQENARLLLGRRMQIILPVGGKMGHMQFKGLVIGVQPYQQRSNDFSVHFKFDHALDRPALQTILG